MVSRTMRALADDGLVAIESDPADARLRLARLPAPGRLLDALERAVALRRPRRVTWEIGARDAPDAMKVLQRAARRLNVPYAIGGGPEPRSPAARSSRSMFWSGSGETTPSSGQTSSRLSTQGQPPGRVTMQRTRDRFVLSLAGDRDGIQVSDPVQLYLDCRSAGERALEAADAIQVEMGW